MLESCAGSVPIVAAPLAVSEDGKIIPNSELFSAGPPIPKIMRPPSSSDTQTKRLTALGNVWGAIFASHAVQSTPHPLQDVVQDIAFRYEVDAMSEYLDLGRPLSFSSFSNAIQTPPSTEVQMLYSAPPPVDGSIRTDAALDIEKAESLDPHHQFPLWTSTGNDMRPVPYPRRRPPRTDQGGVGFGQVSMIAAESTFPTIGVQSNGVSVASVGSDVRPSGAFAACAEVQNRLSDEGLEQMTSDSQNTSTGRNTGSLTSEEWGWIDDLIRSEHPRAQLEGSDSLTIETPTDWLTTSPVPTSNDRPKCRSPHQGSAEAERAAAHEVIRMEAKKAFRKVRKALSDAKPSPAGNSLFDDKLTPIRQTMARDTTISEDGTETRYSIFGGGSAMTSSVQLMPWQRQLCGEVLRQCARVESLVAHAGVSLARKSLAPVLQKAVRSKLPFWTYDRPWKLAALTIFFPRAFFGLTALPTALKGVLLDAFSEWRAGRLNATMRWVGEVIAYPPCEDLQIFGRPIETDEERFERLTSNFDAAARLGKAPSIIDHLTQLGLLGLEDHFRSKYDVAVAVDRAIWPQESSRPEVAEVPELRMRSKSAESPTFVWELRESERSLLTHGMGAPLPYNTVALVERVVGPVISLPIYPVIGKSVDLPQDLPLAKCLATLPGLAPSLLQTLIHLEHAMTTMPLTREEVEPRLSPALAFRNVCCHPTFRGLSSHRLFKLLPILRLLKPDHHFQSNLLPIRTKFRRSVAEQLAWLQWALIHPDMPIDREKWLVVLIRLAQGQTDFDSQTVRALINAGLEKVYGDGSESKGKN